MPLQDVTVTIDLIKPAGLIGLGKPLIITKKTGATQFKNYSDLEAVKPDFAEATEAYQKAAAIFGQGDYRPAQIAIATFDTAATTGPKTAAEALAKYYDQDWFFLVTTETLAADVTALADYIESKAFKMFATVITTKPGLLPFTKYDFTIPFYHTVAGQHPDAALIGAVGSRAVGSATWKFKELKGITPLDINRTELTEIHTSHAIAYVIKSGQPQTSEGTVGTGEYIDVMHGKAWVKVNMENGLQHVLATTAKVPYNSRGIALLEGQATTVLEQGVANGIIAVDDDGNALYTIEAQPRSKVPASERALRVYNGLSFGFELDGAIHEANIKGVILA